VTELIKREDANGVATLIINRPDKLNALNVPVFQELDTHSDALEKETETIGCTVLRRSGRCFAAGHDLGDIAAGEQLPRQNFQAHVIEHLATLPLPVIAAVHGHCYTGALELPWPLISSSQPRAPNSRTHMQNGRSPPSGV